MEGYIAVRKVVKGEYFTFQSDPINKTQTFHLKVSHSIIIISLLIDAAKNISTERKILVRPH